MENLHLKNLKSNTINQMKIKQNALELKSISDNFYRNIYNTLEVIKETNFENEIIKDYLESYFFKITKQLITPIIDDVINLTDLIFKINNWTIDTQITKEELETLELNNNVYLTDDKITMHYTKCLNYFKDEHTLTELVIEIDSHNNIIDIFVTNI